jgi:hypothetical protein
MKVLLIDQTEALVRAWREAFADREDVEVILGDYFECRAGAIVSPANSFGIMGESAAGESLGTARQCETVYSREPSQWNTDVRTRIQDWHLRVATA